MKQIKVENYTCMVGTSAKENWEILSQAKQNHLFFHLTTFPSCYVILQTEEKVSEDIIEQCARICKENTKFRNMRGVYIDYTPVKNVKKGEVVGEIEYLSNRKVQKVKL